MKGMAALQRRVEALECELIGDGDLLAELGAIPNDELMAYIARIAATPWEQLRSAMERAVKRITEMSDLELAERIRAGEGGA